MKLHIFFLAAVAAAVFAVPTSQLSADVVFMNEDGVFDSGVNPGGAEDRDDDTLVGLLGAELLFTDASNGLTATLTTVDIIGADGTSFLAGTGTDDFHETNIGNAGTLAVNTDGSRRRFAIGSWPIQLWRVLGDFVRRGCLIRVCLLYTSPSPRDS